MDPVSIIGLTTTAFGLAERLAKVTKFLLKFSAKFKYADANVSLLIGYLSGINAAILEIAEIVKGLYGSSQYLLLADALKTTLDCTKLSISFLESKLEGLQSESSDERSLVDRLTVIFREAELRDYINGITRHVNVLNLLLNALQSHSILEAKGLLNDPEAQSMMVAMKDETSSLFGLADGRSTTSEQTKVSETSEALDVSFEFDTQILSSRIYAVAYRSHLRESIAFRKQADLTILQGISKREGIIEDSSSVETYLDDSESKTNGETEHMQERHKSRELQDAVATSSSQCGVEPVAESNGKDPSGREAAQEPHSQENASIVSEEQIALINERGILVNERGEEIMIDTSSGYWKKGSLQPKVLLLGTSESGKSTLLKSMELWINGPYTEEELKSFSEIIFENVCQSARVVLELMEKLERSVNPKNEWHVKTILTQPKYGLSSIPSKVHRAIRELCKDSDFQFALHKCAEHMLSDDIV